MHRLATGLASSLALASIVSGTRYLWSPMSAARSFGLPRPGAGTTVTWWLRLKGVRDVASGLPVLALMTWGGPRSVGIVLLAEAVIPAGDMLLVLAAGGSARSALGLHGVTTLLMILGAIPLAAEPR